MKLRITKDGKKHKDIITLRNNFIVELYRDHGFTCTEIAGILSIDASYTSSILKELGISTNRASKGEVFSISDSSEKRYGVTKEDMIKVITESANDYKMNKTKYGDKNMNKNAKDIRAFYSFIKHKANKQGLPFEISIYDMWEEAKKSGMYGVKRFTVAAVDERGYVKGNIRFCTQSESMWLSRRINQSLRNQERKEEEQQDK